MTKEELKNKYSAFITEISEILGLGKPMDVLKLCATTDLFFQPLEKHIEELEKENAELKSIAENQQSSNMSRYFENKKLKEGLAVGSMWNKHLNSQNKALEEERDKYRNMVFDQADQLTEAKELLKRWVDAKVTVSEQKDLIADTEQFLNGEVEK